MHARVCVAGLDRGIGLLANRGDFLVTVEMLDVHFTVNSMHRPPFLPTPRSYGIVWRDFVTFMALL